MKKFFITLSVALALFGGTSCSDYDEPTSSQYQSAKSVSRSATDYGGIPTIETDSAITTFATVLSKAVYDRKDVREFLKAEAGKHFDMNSDILYGAICDTEIGGSTFREILTGYSSEETIMTIEKSVPLLNILIPELRIFDITVGNMDCDDPEIPVAVSTKEGMDLYLSGELAASVPNGELPDFHTIVINQNKRVEAESASRSAGFQYRFLSPNYNPLTNPTMTASRSNVEFTPEEVAYRVRKAAGYFWMPDNSIHSKNFQRDYIYYGLSPNHSDTGKYFHGLSERIAYIKVNPQGYFKMTNDYDDETVHDKDPHLIANSVSRKDKDFTQEELLTKFWSEGSYNFRFELTTSKSSTIESGVIPLNPDQLWNFNYTKEFRHATWFRKRKYTYKVNVSNFTAKTVKLTDYFIAFSGWDLAQESLERYVTVLEEDSGANVTKTFTHEVTKVLSGKVNNELKFGLGIFSNTTGVEGSAALTKKETKTFTVTRKQNNDDFGTVEVNFYHPVIQGTSNNNYVLYPYSTGVVTFALMVQ